MTRIRGADRQGHKPHGGHADMSSTLMARTAATLKARARQYDVPDSDVPGLALRVNLDGSKTWTVRYRHGRRQRRMKIGHYPGMGLAAARKRARTELRKVDDGVDPAALKRERRNAETVGDLAKLYIAEYAKPRKRSWKDDDRMLEAEVLPQWAHRPAREITRRDVRALVDEIARHGFPIMANRVRALLSKLFAFAIGQDIVDANPVTGVPRPGVERARDRVLTDDEIRTFWTALDAQPLAMRAFYRLRLITAQRGGEVANMRWADVDLAGGWWTIPAADSKNGLAHRVPLTAPALELLTALRAAARKDATFVLEGARSKRLRAAALRAAADEGAKLHDFQPHDLRRTAATGMASAGVPRFVIGRVLNHADAGVTAVYDRASYDSEKRTALETWARRLAAILADERPADVIPFARA